MLAVPGVDFRACVFWLDEGNWGPSVLCDRDGLFDEPAVFYQHMGSRAHVPKSTACGSGAALAKRDHLRSQKGPVEDKRDQYPRLREHMASVLMLMKYSPNWKVFMERLDHEFPQWGTNYLLPFPDDYTPPNLPPAPDFVSR
jgi:hypothetical protein